MKGSVPILIRRVICNGCSYSRRVIVPFLVLTVEECNKMLCKFLRRWTFVLIRQSLSFMQRGWINNRRYITHTPPRLLASHLNLCIASHTAGQHHQKRRPKKRNAEEEEEELHTSSSIPVGTVVRGCATIKIKFVHGCCNWI